MKRSILFGFLIVLANCFSAQAQTSQKDSGGSVSDKVEAYYFHMTVRCATCKTVEAETKKDLEILYGGKVNFQVINLEDGKNKTLVEKLKISGQTLLIVKGDSKINITNEGFLYAVNNPEKFKSIIKQRVDPLLK